VLMPENHDERGSFDEQGLDEHDDFDEEDDVEEEDDFDDDDDDRYELSAAGHAWSGSGYPPAGFPPPPGRRGTRHGWLFAVTAVVAAALAFGVVDFAIRAASGSPAASATPSASAPAGNGSGSEPSGGTQFGPPGGAPLPSGAAEHLMIGGKVTAVSATSITLGGGAQTVTAAVTHSTKVSGKVTSIGGIKVGDLVSASITGTSGGKLVADTIQDPASLPSGPGQ
jgi:hypothetical protein